jgi:hypothetical protein
MRRARKVREEQSSSKASTAAVVSMSVFGLYFLNIITTIIYDIQNPFILGHQM